MPTEDEIYEALLRAGKRWPVCRRTDGCVICNDRYAELDRVKAVTA